MHINTIHSYKHDSALPPNILHPLNSKDSNTKRNENSVIPAKRLSIPPNPRSVLKMKETDGKKHQHKHTRMKSWRRWIPELKIGENDVLERKTSYEARSGIFTIDLDDSFFFTSNWIQTFPFTIWMILDLGSDLRRRFDGLELLLFVNQFGCGFKKVSLPPPFPCESAEDLDLFEPFSLNVWEMLWIRNRDWCCVVKMMMIYDLVCGCDVC